MFLFFFFRAFAVVASLLPFLKAVWQARQQDRATDCYSDGMYYFVLLEAIGTQYTSLSMVWLMNSRRYEQLQLWQLQL